LEWIRSDFARYGKNSCMEVFKYFDISSRGHLSVYDLKETVMKLMDAGNISYQDDIYLIFRKYDKDGDGRLTYSEFSDMITPKFPPTERHSPVP
jgi:Ca2+-binding EF-hand superfamily protein